MTYTVDFEHSFMQYTLKIVRDYHEDFPATLLLNCLLGLLIVPRETSFETIPDEPIANLSKWGIDPKSIIRMGRVHQNNAQPDTLRELVRRLRNAVAHFRIEPIPKTEEVKSFRFTDENGFHAVIKLKELRVFVERLAEHLNRR